MSTRIWVAASLLILSALPGTAQEVGSPDGLREGGAAAEVRATTDGSPHVLVWTTAGTAIGAVSLAAIGYQIDRARDVPAESPGLAGLFIGGLVGSTVGSAVASHLASDRDTSLGRRLLITGAIGVAGTALAAATRGRTGAFVVLSIPVAQILSVGR